MFQLSSESYILEVIQTIQFLAISVGLVEPRREKTGVLHMRKQRRRSASR